MKKKKNPEQGKKKRTWGNVEPGPLSEGEAAALGPMKENAGNTSINSPDMDPEGYEGESAAPAEGERKDEWQKLSREEKERFRKRKDGYPKN